MKKILIVTALFPPEPVVSAQISYDLFQQLKSLGESVRVLAPYPSRPHGFNFKASDSTLQTEQDGTRRINSYRYSGKNIFLRFIESISFGFASFHYINSRSKTIDIVYMNTWPLFGQLGVALACILNKVPYILHIQDVYPESITNKLKPSIAKIVSAFLMPLDRYIVRNSKKTVVISQGMKEYIADSRNVAPTKLEVVINWQDFSNFSQVRASGDNKIFTFMYLGNIGPLAGLPFVIRSFARANINAKLIIAGAGSEKESCVELARKFPQCTIEFMEVPQGKVPDVQSIADILILPLIKGAALSSIPSKLPAYMFSAKPILAAVDPRSETERCIVDGNCGWVCEPENEKVLSRLFQLVVLTPKRELEVLGHNSLQFGKTYFSRKTNLEKLVSLFLS